MNKVILGLGSNIDPENNIKKAKELITQKFTVLGKSQFTQTKPIGYLNQDDFINGTIYIETALTLNKLKTVLKTIEQELGRSASTIKSGPRTIDIDIIVFNEQVVDQDFYTRDFLKKSTLEIIPNLKY